MGDLGDYLKTCGNKEKKPEEHDPVNHPSHYCSHPSGIEAITITEHYNFNVGNAIKYIWRAGLKNDAIEDLKKAEWYLRREIEKREKERGVTCSKEKFETMVDMDKFADLGYICQGCAKELGGTWPDNHVATFHEGKCDCCNSTAALANVGDWNWPDGKRRGMRD